MVTPGSRLSDDLYVLYVVGLLWFVIPIYGGALSMVLPSDVANFDRGIDVVAATAGVLALWWGAQGGPLVVSRAAVIHELGSPASRIGLLLPRLARQALTGATFAAVVGALLLAINGGVQEGFAAPALVSAQCAAAAAAVVFQAAIWLVVVHAHDGPRRMLGIAGAAPAVTTAAYVATGASLSSPIGLAVLAGVATVSGIVATVALQWVPVDRLWRRAAAMESMRSSMQTFDFQRVLLDVRRAGDRPQPGNLRLARPWMPPALWRQAATMQYAPTKHGTRLVAAAAALAAIVFFADAGDGIILLAIAGCGGFIALEFSGALAATADQGTLVVHYPSGSGPVLRAQLVTMFGLTVCVGAIAVGWQWTAGSMEVMAAVLLCGFAALGAAVQARLGSPNLGALIDVIGFGAIGPILWARAMLGPIILFVGAVSLSHHLLRPSEAGGDVWATVAFVTAAVAAVIVSWPIEKRKP